MHIAGLIGTSLHIPHPSQYAIVSHEKSHEANLYPDKVNITQHIRSAVSKWPWEHPGASAILVEVTAEIWELLLGREPGALNRIALSRAIKEDLCLTETFKNWGLLWNTHWIFNTHFSVLYYTVLDISEISHFLPYTVLFECSSHSTFYLDIQHNIN